MSCIIFCWTFRSSWNVNGTALNTSVVAYH